MIRRIVIIAIGVAAVFTVAATAFAQVSDAFEVPWSSLAGGGGTTAADEFALNGTIGQSYVGPRQSGGAFTLTGGFQAGISPRVQPTFLGDCNGDGTVTSADLTAEVLEIFDGDGDDPKDVAGGTFAGSPGCDSNGSGEISAADITCVVLIIFDFTCGAPSG